MVLLLVCFIIHRYVLGVDWPNIVIGKQACKGHNIGCSAGPVNVLGFICIFDGLDDFWKSKSLALILDTYNLLEVNIVTYSVKLSKKKFEIFF